MAVGNWVERHKFEMVLPSLAIFGPQRLLNHLYNHYGHVNLCRFCIAECSV